MDLAASHYHPAPPQAQWKPGGAWGYLGVAVAVSVAIQRQKQEKCTSDKRVEIVKKYIWAALEAQNHHNQWPK